MYLTDLKKFGTVSKVQPVLTVASEGTTTTFEDSSKVTSKFTIFVRALDVNFETKISIGTPII